MINASDIVESRELGRPVRLSLPRLLQHMFAAHSGLIREAIDLYTAHYHQGKLQAMNTGSDTGARMACRLADGLTPEQAAYAEFSYRLSLSLRSRVFPAPCLLGQ